MPLNGRTIALKQFCHLVSREPHSFIGEPNLNLRLAALRLKKYNLSVIHIKCRLEKMQ